MLKCTTINDGIDIASDRKGDDMDGDALVDVAARISTREEFVQFLNELSANLNGHGVEWENRSLESFLRAMTRFTEQAKGYYQNVAESVDCDQPSWRLFADILLAAKVYE